MKLRRFLPFRSTSGPESRLIQTTLEGPWLLASALLLALVLLIGPWGNFPLNDDWQYAHVTRRLAETGVFRVDVPIAPTLFLQARLGAWVSQFWGFSHLHLRLLTVALALAFLWGLDQVFARARAPRRLRTLGLFLVVVQPLFLNLSLSFMTEIYGLALAFLGVALWLQGGGRARIGGALMMGLSFWVRQFAVLVFPALLLAEFGGPVWRELQTLWRARKHSPLPQDTLAAARRGLQHPDALPVALTLVAFVAPILLYFPWAKATGNYNPAFATPLGRLLRPAPGFWLTQVPLAIFYATAFLLPLLLWLRLREPSRGAGARGRERGLQAVLLLGAILAAFFGDPGFHGGATLHRHFPFLGNVLTSYGIGPITLTRPYFEQGSALPSTALTPWFLFELVLIALAPVGLRLFSRPLNLVSRFGLWLAGLALFVTIQSYLFAVFDRYHLTLFVGLLMAWIGWLADSQESPSVNKLRDPSLSSRLATPVAILIGGLFAAWSVLGLHDYFAWNEARWRLVARARARGTPPLRALDAGYEVNGWLTFQDGAPNANDPDCDVGPPPWFCAGRPYAIELDEPGRTETLTVLDREPVQAWLRNFPDLVLVEKARD